MQQHSLIDDIHAHWRPASGQAGTLVQRYDNFFWHYGVALSSTHAISWGPQTTGNPHTLGQLVIHELGPLFQDAIHVPYLKPTDILANLIASVPAFHLRWNYGFQGWNCEHWARLVVSGQPICYQVKEQGFGLADVFGTLHFRGEAITEMDHWKSERPRSNLDCHRKALK